VGKLKAKILVVEDERILAIGIKRKLEMSGHIVTGIASSGQEAIEKARKTDPNLILMDIVLKGEMDGIEAAQQIINLCNIPIIYLTAYADEEILERAMITEPYGYILKPFKIDELNANIKLALYKHRTDVKRKELMKKRIMDDYYQFIIQSMNESADYSDTDIRKMLFEAFENSFEKRMKPEFESDLKKQDLTIYEEDTFLLFETYLSWISKLFTGLGIKNKIRSEDNSWYLEFFNCPWSESAPKNPIFCINCNGMIESSFKWINIRGTVTGISNIASNSSKCSFKISPR
jgi:CheY-like chemotaxis protein